MTLEAVGNYVKKRSFLKNEYWKKKVELRREEKEIVCILTKSLTEAPVLPEAKASLNYLVMLSFFPFIFYFLFFLLFIFYFLLFFPFKG